MKKIIKNVAFNIDIFSGLKGANFPLTFPLKQSTVAFRKVHKEHISLIQSDGDTKDL